MIAQILFVVFAAITLVVGYLLGSTGHPRENKPAEAKSDAPVPLGTGMPRYDSRRWARACFHNGFITIEELNAFYETHPWDPSDPDR